MKEILVKIALKGNSSFRTTSITDLIFFFENLLRNYNNVCWCDEMNIWIILPERFILRANYLDFLFQIKGKKRWSCIALDLFMDLSNIMEVFSQYFIKITFLCYVNDIHGNDVHRLNVF